MLPLSLLSAAQGNTILVELKNGETYNGLLVNIDSWMNMNLNDVVCTSRDGEKFTKIPFVYIRGNHIKYLRLEEDVIDKVDESESHILKLRSGGNRGRGRGGSNERGNRGRGGRGDRGSRGGRGGRGARGSRGGRGSRGSRGSRGRDRDSD